MSTTLSPNSLSPRHDTLSAPFGRRLKSRPVWGLSVCGSVVSVVFFCFPSLTAAEAARGPGFLSGRVWLYGDLVIGTNTPDTTQTYS